MLGSTIAQLFRSLVVHRMESGLLENVTNLFIHLVWRILSINCMKQFEFVIVLNDGQCLAVICLYSFSKALVVVICSTLTSTETSIHTDIFWTGQEENKMNMSLVAHLLLPTIEIVLIPWEAVNEEARCCGACDHGILEQFACDLHGNDCTISYMTIDQLAEEGIFPFLFGSE